MYCWTLLVFYSCFTCFVEAIDQSNRNQKSIIDEAWCEDVGRICLNLNSGDDLTVLECIISASPQQVSTLNKPCQNVIWDRIRNITSYEGVKAQLLPVCDEDLKDLRCQPENYLRCLVNEIDSKQKNLKPDCYKTINRIESIAFTDYRWISGFLDKCQSYITKLKCGYIDVENLSNLKTVSCLQNNILKVDDVNCKKEVYRLSELQSNSIKFDAELNLNCREDYQRYCNQYVEGSGRVFPCLMHQLHLDESKLNVKCIQHLKRRERLIAQDFKISKGLLKSCKEDIKRSSCRQNLPSDKTVRLAKLLLCLENFARQHPLTQLTAECQNEIIDHRKLLMDDYTLSPEVVSNCKNETNVYCREIGFGGKTLHCLMGVALNTGDNANIQLGASCLRALEDLMRQTDPGENWNVDPVLHQACDPVVKIACINVKGGNGRVMNCLMDNIRSDIMTDECENALLEIQYFVARDFELDPQLYRACSSDASKYCHMDGFRDGTTGPSYSRQVLPCLYRHSTTSDESQKIEKKCLQQIQRVMRQRAISVNLQPEIEEVCVQDLGYYCQDKLKKGEEMQCLQDNLEHLDDKCQDVVDSFTEMEAERVDLNPYISKYCKKIIESLCANEDDIVECLIENKNHPKVKSVPTCRASIEHFQIISLKDYKFTFKFKQACKSHAIRLCGTASTKSAVVECLSEHILNSTVHGLKSNIPKDCRQQIKAQIFQQREKIDFNPNLKRACEADIDQFCKNVQPGNAQILECLQVVPHNQLSLLCSKEVLKVQKMEVYDNSVDYALITNCAESIDQFCPHHDKETVLGCLKMNKDEKGFGKKCRQIVSHRLMEQSSNINLNPSLQKNCQIDINKFCKHELTMPTTGNKKSGDLIIHCLKNKFKLSKLSNRCEQEMAEILRERALDVNMDPLLRVMCKQELETICVPDEEDSGKTVECLKTAFLSHRIASAECKVEVAGLIEGSEADIQADPLLQRACALDLLTHCKDVEQGNGRKINCLKTIMSTAGQDISNECKNKLKERLEMYKNAAQVAEMPEDLKALYHTVTQSPSKNYFVIVLFMIIGAIFFVGVFCGRFSKRKYRLLKNK